MSVLAVYVQTKENICREVAEKTAELYMRGMSYEDAFQKAKEGVYTLKDKDKKTQNISY